MATFLSCIHFTSPQVCRLVMRRPAEKLVSKVTKLGNALPLRGGLHPHRQAEVQIPSHQLRPRGESCRQTGPAPFRAHLRRPEASRSRLGPRDKCWQSRHVRAAREKMEIWTDVRVCELGDRQARREPVMKTCSLWTCAPRTGHGMAELGSREPPEIGHSGRVWYKCRPEGLFVMEGNGVEAELIRRSHATTPARPEKQSSGLQAMAFTSTQTDHPFVI
ncbi:unnamed protein product [Protopolystoma xenopodis]|uniref:Uncharacterized protein n=1 Tax=Protopolystoma xenopodis TaxID=117903 RepID=A0A3S5ACI7_9PLAT|nr:unnamed protein product [Protopolystoma xenopodis]